MTQDINTEKQTHAAEPETYAYEFVIVNKAAADVLCGWGSAVSVN